MYIAAFSVQASINAYKHRAHAHYVRCRSGLSVAQAVSRRLPTEAVRVQSRFKSCGICSGQSGTGAGFLHVLRIPLPIVYSTNCPTIIIVI
jgi:hypothetical protein